MAGFEDLIRTTLGKQDHPSPERRQAIYRSAGQALERMIEENGTLDAATIERQRARLGDAIQTVEAEYASTADSAAAQEPELSTFAAEPNTMGSTSDDPEIRPVTDSPPVERRESAAPDVETTPAASTGVEPDQTTPPAVAPDVQADIPKIRISDRLKQDPKSEEKAPEVSAQKRFEGDSSPTVSTASVTTSAPEIDVAPSRPASGSEAIQSKAKDPGDGTPDSGKRVEPTLVSPELVGTPESEDDANSDDVAPAAPEAYSGPVLRERRPFAKMLLWAIILAGIGVTLWWAVNFGPAFLNNRLDGSVPNPQTTIESGSFVPTSADGWMTVFVPGSDPGNLVTRQAGSSEIVDIDGGQVARLASNAGGQNNILIQIPEEVVPMLRAKAATFEVKLRAVAGEGHQFAMYCQFSKLGTCGRKRFSASKKQETFIFDMLVNDADLGEDQSIYLAINTDLSGEGRAIDLSSIRVKAGN